MGLSLIYTCQFNCICLNPFVAYCNLVALSYGFNEFPNEGTTISEFRLWFDGILMSLDPARLRLELLL